MGDPTSSKEQESCNHVQGLSMEFETQRIPISTTVLSEPDKLERLIQLVKDIQKISGFYHANLCNFEAIWFEGLKSENLNEMSDLSIHSKLVATKQAPGTGSGTLSTFLCLSKEKYQLTPLPQWLEDRKCLSLHEVQITNILLQVASGIDKLVENGLSILPCLSDVHVIIGQKPGNRIAPNYIPSVKLNCVPVQVLAYLEGASEHKDIQAPANVQDLIFQVFEKLTDNLEKSEVLKLIEENILKGNLINLIGILKCLQVPAAGTLFNVNLPSRQFQGKLDPQLKTLTEVFIQAPDSSPDNNFKL